MMEIEVYGRLLIRNFWIQHLIACYKICYFVIIGIFGIIYNKMSTAAIPPRQQQLILSPQQSTKKKSSSPKKSSTILSNQETDCILPPNNNYIINKKPSFKLFWNKKQKQNNISKSPNGDKDVTDNKSDHIFRNYHNNVKRMAELYKNENDRLKTFEDWPLSFIDKEVLAKTGFFYTGDDDKVKCVFCEAEIGRWEPSDDPIVEHTRWSPNCPLMRRRSTNNIPIDAEALDRILPPISYDVCGANDIIEVRPNAYAEGSISSFSPISSPTNSLPSTPNAIQYSNQSQNFLYPDHPEYAIESARLRSFAEWPRNMKQKPEQLSEAGFFYTGIGDRVKCFSCGGGLKDWDDNDDPWEQHALWLDNCRYLKLMKGTVYIEAIKEKFKTENSDEENEKEDESKEQQSLETNLIKPTSQFRSFDESAPSTSTSTLSSTSSSGLGTSNDEELASTSSGILDRNSQQSIKNNLTCSKVNCNHCNSSSSDEETGSILNSETKSVSSVNSNSSKEAETVCKQPKLDCHHHHISRELQSKTSDSNKNSKSIAISEEKLCKICYAAEYNTAFLPCGHVVACAKCASSVTKCPMCRKPFTDVMRVYFS